MSDRYYGIDNEVLEILSLYHSCVDPNSTYIHWSDLFLLYRLKFINVDIIELVDIMLLIRSKYNDNIVNKEEKQKQIEKENSKLAELIKNKFRN